MTTRQVGVSEMTDEQRRVSRAAEALHRDGASPAGALELLAAIVADRTWERLSDVAGKPFAGRFRDFVAARPPFGLGFGLDQLPKVLELRHPREAAPDVADQMATMRTAVRGLLMEEIKPAAPMGRPDKESTTHNTSAKRDAAAAVARLKRDDPDLAEKVMGGEVSAYAAARSKGWKPPRIQVTTPARTAAHLRKHMSPDQIAELARLLAVTDGT
jgi:hypothetical protein